LPRGLLVRSLSQPARGCVIPTTSPPVMAMMLMAPFFWTSNPRNRIGSRAIMSETMRGRMTEPTAVHRPVRPKE